MPSARPRPRSWPSSSRSRPTTRPATAAAHAERAAELLEGLGFAVERHPVPEDQVRANGMISATNLVVRRRFGEGGPVIALNAHGDVVPPGEGWTRDPFGAEVVDGWMYGRGVAVSKSDFATYAWALKALEASRRRARRHGRAPPHLRRGGRRQYRPRLPAARGHQPSRTSRISAGFSYGVVTAHNGCLHLEVQVDGKSAHAAMPYTGIDALEAANARPLRPLCLAQDAGRSAVSEIPGIGSPQLTVGLIKGGINTNVVPDRVTFRLDRRMIPEERAAEVEAELRAVIAEAAKAFPEAKVEVRQILVVEPLAPLPGGERMTELLCRHAQRRHGRAGPAQGRAALHRRPALRRRAASRSCSTAPGPHTIEEANAHRADERLPLADLRKATEVVALTLLDLLTPQRG